MFRIRVIFACGWLLALAGLSSAQQTIDVGSISGRVLDEMQMAIPGVTVVATHQLTNVATSTATDEEGRYRFPYLRIGAYEIRATLSGFTDASRQLNVSAGSAFDLPLVLTLATITETIMIVDEAPVIDAARSQLAATVFDGEVQSLPMNGRNFLDLALLVPGVAPANIASSQLFPETSAVPGVSLSVGSQRNLSNNFVVDGLSANDDAAGLSGITVTVDAIEQFQVVTSGAQAELGRALGGYINVVTKSGSNTTRGTVYEYFRDDRFNAANALSGSTLPMRQSQFGGSLGGPIVANRTFYFGNVEHRALDQGGLVAIGEAASAAVNAQLHAVNYPGAGVTTGLFDSPVDSTNVLGKLDHSFEGGHYLTARYSRYGVSSSHSRGAGGLSAPSASTGLNSADQAFAVNNMRLLSSNTAFETRLQFATSDLAALPTDRIGPAVSIAGVATFGTSSTSPTARHNQLFQVVNNLSHQAGAHTLRTGIDVLYNNNVITFPRSARGSYVFSSMANFIAGSYNNAGFTQTFGATKVAQTNPNVGAYLQDEWHATSNLTVNAGLRYDLQFLETIDTDTSNVSPRLGVAWAPTASGNMVIRGSAGLFYDRVPLRALANALLSAGNTTDVTQLKQFVVSLSPTQGGAPVFPNILAGVVPAVTLPNLTTMDRYVQNAYSRQLSVEVERHLGSSTTTLAAGYEYLEGRNLLMSVNQNVPACVAEGNNNGCRPNPAYANNSQYSSVGESSYQGMHLSLVRRTNKWGHYRVSYTLSKAMNNVGEFFFSSPIDPTDLSKDWSRADNDRRHRLVLNGSFETRGFRFGALLQAYSAPPFNITSGVTTIQGTAGRPVVNGQFIERNAGEGTPFFTLNARVSRTFQVGNRTRFEILAEGFNLTNRTNVITRNTNFGAGAYPVNPAPAFNLITAVAEPRSFQVGARVRF